MSDFDISLSRHEMQSVVHQGGKWKAGPIVPAPAAVPRVGEWVTFGGGDPWRCVVGVYHSLAAAGDGVTILALAETPGVPAPAPDALADL